MTRAGGGGGDPCHTAFGVARREPSEPVPFVVRDDGVSTSGPTPDAPPDRRGHRHAQDHPARRRGRGGPRPDRVRRRPRARRVERDAAPASSSASPSASPSPSAAGRWALRGARRLPRRGLPARGRRAARHRLPGPHREPARGGRRWADAGEPRLQRRDHDLARQGRQVRLRGRQPARAGREAAQGQRRRRPGHDRHRRQRPAALRAGRGADRHRMREVGCRRRCRRTSRRS